MQQSIYSLPKLKKKSSSSLPAKRILPRGQARCQHDFKFTLATTPFSLSITVVRMLKKTQHRQLEKNPACITSNKTVSRTLPIDLKLKFISQLAATVFKCIFQWQYHATHKIFLLGSGLKLSSFLSICFEWTSMLEDITALLWKIFPYLLVLLFCPSVQLADH